MVIVSVYATSEWTEWGEYGCIDEWYAGYSLMDCCSVGGFDCKAHLLDFIV